MKLLKINFMPLRSVLLFLLLLGSSNWLSSANESLPTSEDQIDQRQIISETLVGEQVDNLCDFILPTQKSLLFIKGSFSNEFFEAHSANHTTTSLDYIKRSRHIFPGLGVKKVIFPFHVFL